MYYFFSRTRKEWNYNERKEEERLKVLKRIRRKNYIMNMELNIFVE